MTQKTCRFLLILLLAALSFEFINFSKINFFSKYFQAYASEQKIAAEQLSNTLKTQDLQASSNSLWTRISSAGPMVSLVLYLLMFMSTLTWAIVIAKWVLLRRVKRFNKKFLDEFWDSRSLNELNNKIDRIPYSPVRELFCSGYAELIRGNQMKDKSQYRELALGVTVDNLSRSIHKTKQDQRRKLERHLSLLAISASASPFIGLFGTVWGIMASFEEIARTGSSSLAAVAPGISEALIATAFGLAAAIPAVIGYNISINKIRELSSQMDNFSADFLNIVQRYLVLDQNQEKSSILKK